MRLPVASRWTELLQMSSRIHPVAACALALVSLAVSAGLAVPSAQTPAQQPPAPQTQTPTFRTRVDAVTVDVIATDKQGKPVTDLTAADFEVKENGKVQAVDSFKRILTIFLDDYHTRLGNSMAIREKLAKFVRELDPRDMVAIVYPLTPTLAVTFSRDATPPTSRKFSGSSP